MKNFIPPIYLLLTVAVVFVHFATWDVRSVVHSPVSLHLIGPWIAFSAPFMAGAWLRSRKPGASFIDSFSSHRFLRGWRSSIPYALVLVSILLYVHSEFMSRPPLAKMSAMWLVLMAGPSSLIFLCWTGQDREKTL